jgi:SAM-dependent methyltransferase
MGIVGGALGYHLLRWIAPGGESRYCPSGVPAVYQGRSKLEVLFGPDVWTSVAGKVVIDYGCGHGADAVDLARHGARKVIGLDVREHMLQAARRSARDAGVADRCLFTTAAGERADVIVSVDAFEHFADPAGVLASMRTLVRDGGRALVAFGPTWYHPIGGHGFSVFPWAHLVFTERALLRWRADHRDDGATRFSEIEGGLNQMTIRGFERLVGDSAFEFERLEAVPIRKLRWAHTRVTRELCTSIVRCVLRPRGAATATRRTA